MAIDDFCLISSVHQLKLRPHCETDAAFMLELNSNPAVTAHTPDGPLPDISIAKAIIQSMRDQFNDKKIGRLIVEDPTTGRAIGWCGLK